MFRKYLLACAIGMVAVAALLGGADHFQPTPAAAQVTQVAQAAPAEFHFTCPNQLSKRAQDEQAARYAQWARANHPEASKIEMLLAHVIAVEQQCGLHQEAR